MYLPLINPLYCNDLDGKIHFVHKVSDLDKILWKTISKVIHNQLVINFGPSKFRINMMSMSLPSVCVYTIFFTLVVDRIPQSPKWLCRIHMDNHLGQTTYHRPSPIGTLPINLVLMLSCTTTIVLVSFFKEINWYMATWTPLFTPWHHKI
jgi:hypothetical protein